MAHGEDERRALSLFPWFCVPKGLGMWLQTKWFEDIFMITIVACFPYPTPSCTISFISLNFDKSSKTMYVHPHGFTYQLPNYFIGMFILLCFTSLEHAKVTFSSSVNMFG